MDIRDFRNYMQKLRDLDIELMHIDNEVTSHQASEVKKTLKEMYEYWVITQYVAEEKERGYSLE